MNEQTTKNVDVNGDMIKLCEKIRASTQWWHHDCELKLAACDALAAKDAEIKALRGQRGELLEALSWYAYVTEDANRYGITRDLAQAELRSDRGKRAKEAIAKAKEQPELSLTTQKGQIYLTEEIE